MSTNPEAASDISREEMLRKVGENIGWYALDQGPRRQVGSLDMPEQLEANDMAIIVSGAQDAYGHLKYSERYVTQAVIARIIDESLAHQDSETAQVSVDYLKENNPSLIGRLMLKIAQRRIARIQ